MGHTRATEPATKENGDAVEETERKQEESIQSTNRDDPTEVIRQLYEEYLSSHDFSSNHEEKIEQLLEEPSSLGNAVAMFEMLFYFK